MTKSRKMIHGSVSTEVRNIMGEALDALAEGGNRSQIQLGAVDRIWKLIRDHLEADESPPRQFMEGLVAIVGDSLILWEETPKTDETRHKSLAGGATLRILHLAATTPELNAWINMTFFPMGCGWTPKNEDWTKIGLQWRDREGDSALNRFKAKIERALRIPAGYGRQAA